MVIGIRDQGPRGWTNQGEGIKGPNRFLKSKELGSSGIREEDKLTSTKSDIRELIHAKTGIRELLPSSTPPPNIQT